MSKIRLNSETLQDWLDRNNLSQRKFGRLHRLSSGYISQILSGKRHLGPATRQTIQDATGLTFDDLFTKEP